MKTILALALLLTLVACIQPEDVARIGDAGRLSCTVDGVPALEIYIEASPGDEIEVVWFAADAGPVSCVVVPGVGL